MSEPSFQKTFLACEKCEHEWIDHLPINVRVELWAAWRGMIRCPKCGGEKSVLFGQKPRETPVEPDRSVARRIATWCASHDTGLSSMCIVAVMSGADLGCIRVEYPRDARDLGRCLRLLRLIPEWRPDIEKMAGVGYVWAEFARRWDELERTMIEEVGMFWEKKGARSIRTNELIHVCELAGLEADPGVVVRYTSDGAYCGYEPAHDPPYDHAGRRHRRAWAGEPDGK